MARTFGTEEKRWRGKRKKCLLSLGLICKEFSYSLQSITALSKEWEQLSRYQSYEKWRMKLCDMVF